MDGWLLPSSGPARGSSPPNELVDHLNAWHEEEQKAKRENITRHEAWALHWGSIFRLHVRVDQWNTIGAEPGGCRSALWV